MTMWQAWADCRIENHVPTAADWMQASTQDDRYCHHNERARMATSRRCKQMGYHWHDDVMSKKA